MVTTELQVTTRAGRTGQLLQRAGRAARRGPDPGAGRRPDRRPPDRADPPGLRGQRQPRAQDPDRRHLAAGRGGRGGRRRPGGRPPVRQPDGGRVGPADRPGGPDHRPVPAAGRQPAGRPGGGRRGRRAERGGRPPPGGRRAAPGHPDHRRGHRAARCWAAPASSASRSATWWRTPWSTPIPVPGWWSPPHCQRTGEDDDVEITVSDNGIGIPAAELERIFERFYRVDYARSRANGGTGLGLSIVKHIAAIHGGDVSVWSQLGRGSTFTIKIPDPPAARHDASAPSSPVDDVAQPVDHEPSGGQAMTTSAGGGGRGVLPRGAVLHAGQGGLRGPRGRRRGRGPRRSTTGRAPTSCCST